MNQSDYGIVIGYRGKKTISDAGWKKLRRDFVTKISIIQTLHINKDTINRWEKEKNDYFPKDFTGADRRTGEDIANWRDKRKQSDYELKKAQGEIKKLRTALTNISDMYTRKPQRIPIPKPTRSKTEATANVLLSDWHVDEIVKPEMVNWRNKYNPNICKERIGKLFEGIVKLTNIERSGVILNELSLFLLGDFITGHIHDESKKTNSMLPVDAALFAEGLIISGIDYLKQYAGYKKITVRPKVGNHGRTTDRIEYSTGGHDSLEWYMYQHLADHYKKDNIVSFDIRDSNIDYCTIYDKIIRYMHGHEIKYNGGVGGIEIPAYKAISQWDKETVAACTFFGHYHLGKSGENFVSNASVIGYNSFAQSMKCSFQTPRQQLVLIDSHHPGIQCVRPVFVS